MSVENIKNAIMEHVLDLALQVAQDMVVLKKLKSCGELDWERLSYALKNMERAAVGAAGALVSLGLTPDMVMNLMGDEFAGAELERRRKAAVGFIPF